MKIFVTGICGRLGRALVAEAARRDHEVVGLDIVPWPEKFGAPPSHATIHQGNYADTALVERLLAGCEGLVHAGGPHGGTLDQFDLAQYIDSHTVQVARMLDMGRADALVSAVLCSTMEVQIGRDWSANGAAFIDEETPPRPDSPYSFSRLLMEQVGALYAQLYGTSICSLRFMAFGYGEDRKAGLSLLARTVPVRDVARAVLIALERRDLKGEVFNIGPDTPLTALDIGAAVNGETTAVLEKYYPGSTAVLERTGIKIRSSYFWPVTGIRKAKLVLGWHPEYSFKTWLEQHDWQAPAHVPDKKSGRKVRKAAAVE